MKQNNGGTLRNLHMAKVKRRTCKTLFSWEQVDSAVREMAESEFLISQSKDNASIKEHIYILKCLVNAFVKKQAKGCNYLIRTYRFGKVEYSKGRVHITLNPDLAGEYIGKP